MPDPTSLPHRPVSEELTRVTAPAPPETIAGATREWGNEGPGPKSSRGSNLLPERFEVINELGRGGMGVVYLARQRDLGRLVAVKVLIAGQYASLDQRRRFGLEVRAAAQLSHPHIVPLYEAGEHEGAPYLVMPFVEGVRYDQALRDPSVSMERRVVWLAEVAEATGALHAAGIVHRDVKPSNVLIDEEGRALLTDFGLAKLQEDQGPLASTRTGVAVGTPGFMAPEQAAGEKTIGPPTDVYALGAILYVVLTGRPPFLGDSPLATTLQALERDPDPPSRHNPAAPRDLELICLKCLERSPGQRYPTAQGLAEDLRRYLDDVPPLVAARGRRDGLVRWCRRNFSIVLLVGVLTFGYLGALAMWLLGQWDGAHQGLVTLTYVFWFGATVVAQRLEHAGRLAFRSRALWLGCSSLAVMAMAVVSRKFFHENGIVRSPFVEVFFALIAWSGLWGDPRLVWVAAVCGAAGYLGYLLDGALFRPEFHVPMITVPANLLVMALVTVAVATLARRLERLARHADGTSSAGPGRPGHRPPPPSSFSATRSLPPSEEPSHGPGV